MNFTYRLSDIESTASQILKYVKSKNVLFSGEMGSGKTTLIKELVKQSGSKDRVSSPTYSLVNEYEGITNSVYHFDFYRIEDELEAYDMGFEEYLDSSNQVFIEWPEKIPNLWPQHYSLLEFTAEDEQTRTIVLTEF
ncbi:tRNA (adenosine(37)-N6)-threonylcarbamoyltransferase complex ATPase subunit type 1 TsaE [Psychroflexus sp. MES1-P1E]|uniref:tRNA (adenosine(37)-N6)-threonylcarbamoyltransferase complex ATPase subunit type 1 TsaE n=1 Tax=Psychroflexus sp. MES1-P1E TaxID=2058320 RepID=UPI000C7E54A5|nr:tRNA (adenosine(37)-N6)-threonylcarbamoyltransferase complex ATPase subunit type 1 TsaE [Psychroflexus sp. MES1-P1E]PKG43370.1 tRNA (adenosine(37)-N6)-threonylcarbamoyltransferase complex ATPase subunit type 1 TsaE [Psychroflexus sp. MES1-P1E]